MKVSTEAGAVSSGQRNGLGEDLTWFHPAERLSRARVELSSNGVELVLGVEG